MRGAVRSALHHLHDYKLRADYSHPRSRRPSGGDRNLAGERASESLSNCTPQCTSTHGVWSGARIMAAFTGPNGGPDAWIGAYAFGCASCFGISHIESIHLRLLRWVPSFYNVLNPLLPCGRALFLLAFLQRGVVNQERAVAAAGE
jgi:hypothetical protein